MKILLEDDIMAACLDGETAFLNKKSGRYYSLNQSGTNIWEMLKKYRDTDKVFDKMLEEYDVDENLLKKDIDNLISKLVDAGLIKEA